MLYRINNGIIRYAADTIIENINIEIKDNEKIAVIGRNGSGKTSLLRLIAEEIELSKRDSDEHIYIEQYGKIRIGYLSQIPEEDLDITLEEEINKVYEPVLQMMDRMEELLDLMVIDHSDKIISEYADIQERFFGLGGYDYAKDMDIVLGKLGFGKSDYKKYLNEFSGGELTKISLAKVMLEHPDIMLLDEPTNHLDVNMIVWLENFINHYEKAVVIVSHDRMFLDRTVKKIYEIEHKTVTKYSGNYTDYVSQKLIERNLQAKKYEEQQREMARLKETAERFKNIPTKSAMARAKLKYIERMEKVEKPKMPDLRTFHMSLEPAVKPAREIFRSSRLRIGYDNPMYELTVLIKRGEKVGIIGGNGTGKTTLLKTITGEMEPLSGSFTWGENVQIGYFAQQTVNQASDKTVLDEFWDEFPLLGQNEVRKYLGAFMFTQESVYKKTGDLSGGERARLELAKIFKKGPNVLILDEPTNHMDLQGKEALENIIIQYTGTVLFVSHDRYFVQKAADRLLVVNENGIDDYPGTYSSYIKDKNKA